MCDPSASHDSIHSCKSSIIKVVIPVDLGPSIGTLQCLPVLDAAYHTATAIFLVRVSVGFLLRCGRIAVTLIGDNKSDAAAAAGGPPGLLENVAIPWLALSDNLAAPETDPALPLLGL